VTELNAKQQNKKTKNKKQNKKPYPTVCVLGTHPLFFLHMIGARLSKGVGGELTPPAWFPCPISSSRIRCDGGVSFFSDLGFHDKGVIFGGLETAVAQSSLPAVGTKV
jgi:hypothetical protein